MWTRLLPAPPESHLLPPRLGLEPIGPSKACFGPNWGFQSLIWNHCGPKIGKWEAWNQYIYSYWHTHLSELVPKRLLAPKLGTNPLKFQIDAKVHPNPPWQDLAQMGQNMVPIYV